MTQRELELVDVGRFLRERYGSVADVRLLKGGAWSIAFKFNVGERAFVVRFGKHIEDYEKDRMAGAWTRALLPTPAVLDVGEAFDGAFAVSERLEGDILDALPPDRLATAIDALLETLAVLEDVTLPGTGFGMWSAPTGDAPHDTWGEFLVSVAHRDDVRLRGWRDRLAAVPVAKQIFDRAQALLEQLACSLPDRRCVVHGDLLAGNVLVNAENRTNAVFDWGNALAGDPLYDLAWLIFWAPWHPGIEPAQVRRSTESRFDDINLDERLLCYQLHIALDGMQYQAFAGHLGDLGATAQHAVGQLLEQS